MSFLTLNQYDIGGDLFVDELIVDRINRQIIFISIFGNESFLQQLRGRISLPDSATQSLRDFFVFNDSGGRLGRFYIQKEGVTKIAKVHNDMFVSLSHLFYYHPAAEKLLYENKQHYLISKNLSNMSSRLWNVVKNLADIPLINEWEPILIPLLKEKGMICSLRSMSSTSTLIGYEIKLDTTFNKLVSELVLTKKLAIPTHLVN